MGVSANSPMVSERKARPIREIRHRNHSRKKRLGAQTESCSW